MAVRFDAVGDLLKRETSNILSQSPANTWTMCAWVKRKVDTGAFATALYANVPDVGGSGEVFIETDTGGDRIMVAETGMGVAESDVDAGVTYVIDTWYFVAYTRTATSRSLHWGTEAGGMLTKITNADTRTFGSGTMDKFWIGNDVYSENFNGEIALVRLWNVALSDSELDLEWRSLTPVRSSGLRGDWRLASAASATTDSSGNSLTLTLGGTLADATNPTMPTMAAAPLVQRTKRIFTGTTTATKAFDQAVTAGDLIVIAQNTYLSTGSAGALITTPTDTQSNDYRACFPSEVIFNTGTANAEHMQVFLAIAKSTGTCTVTLGHSSTSCLTTALMAEFNNVSTDTMVLTAREGAVNNTGSATADSGPVITDAGVLLLGFCGNASGGNPTTWNEGSGWANVIKESDANTNQPAALEYRVTAAGGSYSATYGITSSKWGCLIVGFLPAETTTGTVPTPQDTGVTTASYWPLGENNVGCDALYDAAAGAAGKTLIVFAGSSGNLAVVTFDHQSGSFDAPVTGISSGWVNDGHALPTVCKTDDGKYQVFGGAHATALKYFRSTNAHDASAWTAKSDVTSEASYPAPFYSSNSKLMLVYRSTATAGGSPRSGDWVYRISSDNGDTWGSEVAFLDGTAVNVWYPSFCQDGDTLHISLVWADDTDTLGAGLTVSAYQRYGVYYMRIEDIGNTRVLKSANGTTLTGPVTKASLDANCVVAASAFPEIDVHTTLAVGSDGNPAVAWVRGQDINHRLLFSRWTGSAWSSPVAICASGIDDIEDLSGVFPTAINKWTAYVIRKGTTGRSGDINDTDVGGHVDRYTSIDNGATWTRQGQVSSRSQLNIVAKVKDGISPVQYVSADLVAIGANNGHLVAWGEPSEARRFLLVRH